MTTSTTPSTVTLSAVGDTELGDTPQLPPSPATYMSPVRSALAAPIVFGNLEGTMYDGLSASKCGPDSTECYAFRVPTAYARIYRAEGFTVLNSANNHSHDFGDAGVASTSAALRAAGIAQAGLPGPIAVVHLGATAVAFVDFAPYLDTNDMLNSASAAALIRRAHALAGVVVVYMHSGAEGSAADHVTRQTEYYVGEDRGNPYQFAHFAIDAGADLVLASGPHVLRGMQFYRGHLIAYSLGDFANYYNFGGGGDLAYSAILRVTLTPSGRFVSAHYTSLLLSPSGQPRVDPRHAAAAFVNGLSRQDFGASAALVTGAGGVVEPVAGR
ncbi:MAG TPA: CapA family protein [Acidimicrobiales bacterium]|nr:CapA family protein [Acidimicrobiales bacterium]